MLPEYATGARNAVHTCLAIGPRDRVAVIFDRERAEIAQAIQEEVGKAGAELRSWTLEDVVERPARSFPASFGEELRAFKPTASFFIAESRPGEILFRMPMRELLVDELRCRHGHMVNCDRTLMLQGMSADYEEIYQVTRRVYEVVRQAARIEVTSRLGTELVATFAADRRWVPADGRYHEQGRWGNLPEGEVFTAPLNVEGQLAGQELGDHFDRRYGFLESPALIQVRGGRAVAVDVPGNRQLQAELEEYLRQEPCSSQVGEFAIGTNVGLTDVVGNFTQDEKFPGVHVAFGDPYPSVTGAGWTCSTHIDVLVPRATVTVDGRAIMEDGRFLV
jgi:leucyl aminopeptidase (aminopeptidase T)